ncbi:uncharacterized protein PpBr36_10103 [Pyricularia pennisetigena]|uniref:uncharacterized protein n=1 Tax=Pyricularia pennisetigena TaxID=1578925 RepID=UPI00115050E4|nr:uncharacterized protein PpBr36_10103 [Pyricularia pennisetigena]TLS22352.1 hypothetical protein PpBr36_10103 [Pyricularia pennisetigena]
MASETLFEPIPPFPDDVPTASITTISLGALRAGDDVAARSLLDACKNLGFFLLDLRGDELGEAMGTDIDQLMGEAGREIMGLSTEAKEQYHVDIAKGCFEGYKIRGIGKTETNQPDRFEWFNIGEDGLVDEAATPPLPVVVQQQLPLIRSYVARGKAVAATIHRTLAVQLGLPADAFASFIGGPEDGSNGSSAASRSALRLMKFDPSRSAGEMRTSLRPHTDLGVMTLLANIMGGLQILAPGSAASDPAGWLWVRPKPRHLVVNIGDTMVEWTGGLLRSNTHRVNYAPGEQRLVDRYSMAFFLKPKKEASMRNLLGQEREGGVVDMTFGQWEIKKTLAFASDQADSIVNRRDANGQQRNCV